MTEIVRASLGLPTLRAGPQFQNSKPHIILKKEPQICLGHCKCYSERSPRNLLRG